MPKVREIFDRAGKRPRGAGRSLLYRWMRTNHAEFARAFEAERPSWEALCAEFAEAGLIDRTGKPPSTATARKTWERVRKDVAAARTKAEAERKPLVSLSLAVTPLPSPAPCEPSPPADRPSAVSPPVRRATGADDDPIARLRRTLNERSGRY